MGRCFQCGKCFFEGVTLSKSITHTNLALLPKKDVVQSFSDMRRISLSNFLNKVISRVIHDMLEDILPLLISKNPFEFVKGRNISQNVLLAQEIIYDIRLTRKPANVVLKLDKAKAYDRVRWSFLIKVLEKLGFDANMVDKIQRLLQIIGISIPINGQAQGFFHSTRGIKQGDLLSPALFILTAGHLNL